MSITALLKTECQRRLEESRLRIHRCLDLLGEERTWHRPNANTPAVGNLVLHLCGNVGQWITATLGDRPDERDRDAEFAAQGSMTGSELKHLLDHTVVEAIEVVMLMDEGELERTRAVQCYRESGVAILVHVVEHFSYHTGQITLHTKLLCDVDTGWYAGQDLGPKG